MAMRMAASAPRPSSQGAVGTSTEVAGGDADRRSGGGAGGGVRDHPAAEAEDAGHGVAGARRRLLQHRRRRGAAASAYETAEVEVLPFEQTAGRRTGRD